MISTQKSIPRKPRKATKKCICNEATVNASEATTPNAAQRTFRIAGLYRPEEETAWANFLSVCNCSSSWRRIFCSSSESGTSTLFHDFSKFSMQTIHYLLLPIVWSPLRRTRLSPRPQRACWPYCLIPKSDANVIDCPGGRSPHFVNGCNISGVHPFIKEA